MPPIQRVNFAMRCSRVFRHDPCKYRPCTFPLAPYQDKLTVFGNQRRVRQPSGRRYAISLRIITVKRPVKEQLDQFHVTHVGQSKAT